MALFLLVLISVALAGVSVQLLNRRHDRKNGAR